MNIFFNIQSTGLSKSSSIISLGLIADDNSSIYVELNDFNHSQITDFIEKNIMTATIEFSREYQFRNGKLFSQKYPTCEYYTGNKENIRKKVLAWIDKKDDGNIELISDTGYFGFIFLIDFLYGDGLNSKFKGYIDINQLISYTNKITSNKAFDISRKIEILKEEDDEILMWNALYRADSYKRTYNKLIDQKGEDVNEQRTKKRGRKPKKEEV